MKVTLLIILMVCVAACNSGSNSKQKNDEVQVPVQLPEDAETISNLDSSFMKSFIINLKGIEKHIVRNDFYLMASLLAYNGDTISHNRMVDILKNTDEFVLHYNIEVLDRKAGYIRYSPRGAEVVYTSTYWNLKNGAELIGLEEWGCGPVCQSEISFTKFENGTYDKLTPQTVIPSIDALPSRLVPDYTNIQFCLEDNCIELIWSDGEFRLDNK